jgi:hypothetical protein
VVDRDALAWKDLILPKGIHTISNNAALSSWCSSLLLLGKLASGAHGRVDEMGTHCMKLSGALRGRQSTTPHQELLVPE